MFKVEKTGFKGWGVSFFQNKLYIGACLKHEQSAGIELITSNANPFFIIFTEDLFEGDVVSAYISGSFPDCLGYRFAADSLDIVDPYSSAISEDKTYSIVRKEKAFASFENDKHVNVPYSDTYMYLASIKGQTMLDNKIRSNKGTFAAFEKKAEYIKSMGFNSVLIMPVYEVRNPKTYEVNPLYNSKDTLKKNYWGFGAGFHFALKKDYSASEYPEYEFKHMIKTYHDNGIEIILVMQYDGTFSKEYVIDSLIHYVREYHIDGFRLIGDSIPFEDIISNPFLTKTKIISECYPSYSYTSKKSPAYKTIGVISSETSNDFKRFLKGDEDMVGRVALHMKDNSLHYSPISFLSDFSGLTLYDLVCYNVKHNEPNGEKNTDGTDYNYSWNCGVEGDTTKKAVLSLRKKQIKNALLLMLLSQGTPMIKAGDEWLNTQLGNNNPYCQDNETGWVKFRTDKTAKNINLFIKSLIEFRKRHSVLHQPKPIVMSDYISCKVPDMTYHGEEAYKLDTTPVNHSFSILYSGEYSRQYTKKTEQSVLISINMYWESQNLVLPKLNSKDKWKLLYCSENHLNDNFDEKDTIDFESDIYEAPARSISIFLL